MESGERVQYRGPQEPNGIAQPVSAEAARGAAIYNQMILSLYDLYVLKFSNTFAWKCPSQLILDFYNCHISNRHLDVGVGTGYFLDKCQFPAPEPAITLLDLNPNSLRVTAKRLGRYNPTLLQANVLDPIPLREADFDSIAFNYLLHCLPGDLMSKGVVFKNIARLLSPHGKVFGTTILGTGVKQNWMAQRLMKLYNSKGIFSNRQDTFAGLDYTLKKHFHDYTIYVKGCVAFFVAGALR
jgi:ubiquinone/menaquinone biosynthesis C-methylase UbiE